MPHLQMSFQDWQSCLKEKSIPLEGFKPQSTVKLQVRCDLQLNLQTTDLSCPEAGDLFNILLFYVTGGKQKD